MNGEEKEDRTNREADSEGMAVVSLAQTDSSAWIEQARNGSASAFEQLYRRHVGHVYAICLRMTANATEAEELTQEAFVRAWEKLESFRSESQFGTWLHRIAVNRVLDAQRSAKRRAKREAPHAHGHSAGEVPAGMGKRSAAAPAPHDPDLRMDLEEAIAALPEGARTVFVLHDVEGYRHAEIAALAGIAEGTSKAHLHRARKLLREMLKP